MIKNSNFEPPKWLTNCHLQTIWASQMRPKTPFECVKERLELPDGDYLDLAWMPGMYEANTPTVLILHGLTGGERSPYIRSLMREIHAAGWRGVMMQFRGAGEQPNRLPRGYHPGDTQDLNFVIKSLKKRFPNTALAAVGFSMGGNILLKWLGEKGNAAALSTAVAVSVPFQLEECVQTFKQGFSRFYQWTLLRRLRRAMRQKFKFVPMPLPLPDWRKIKDFLTFDLMFTLPLHGYVAAPLDYYRKSSSRHYLKSIAVPTLILHAKDDPLMHPGVVPTEDELAECVTLELSAHGGHLGFLMPSQKGMMPRSWLDDRIPAHLHQFLDQKVDKKADVALDQQTAKQLVLS